MRNILLLLLLGILCSVAFSKDVSGKQRMRNDVADSIAEGGEEEEEEEMTAEEETVDVLAEERRTRLRVDMCKKKKCYRGEVCHLTSDRKAECRCIDNCQPEVDTRYHVCSNKNETYTSECMLDRDHCLCKHKLPGCSNTRLNKIQLDYYGQCKELTECPEDEFKEFPFRMKEWLFLVMKQLAARDELGEYIELLEKARNDANHTEAVLWKFCDLDTSPQDRQVSRRELQYIVQSLKAWEHCLVPFLTVCDKDENRKITLNEWGICLGLDPKKIMDRCIDIRARARRY